jgi:hypothetical protein
MAASAMCGACGPTYAAMGRIFVGFCLIYKLLLTSGCFRSQCRYNIRLEGIYIAAFEKNAIIKKE